MHYLAASAAVVASASFALAAPAEIMGRQTFDVNQVEAGSTFKSGPLQLMKTYNKFAKKGAVAPSYVAAAAAAAQSGSVTATPEQYDSEYLCPVKVGSQTLTLDFDTGSSDLWVFSTLLSSSESSGHTLYNPKTGTKETGETWNITYGDGSGAAGVVYADQVVIGSVTATSQAVEAATSVSSTFVSDTDSDGLVGLAFSSINTVEPKQATTFFDTVSSTLAEKLFTADLKKDAAGTYAFGYIDSSKYTGSLTYTDVDDSEGFWEFTAGGYSVGSSNGTGTSDIGTAIADTGTTLFYLPTAAVKKYYAQVSGAKNSETDGGYVFPCSATLPAFNVEIGGSTFTVPGTYLNYAPTTSAGTTCFGGIQSNTGIGFSIFGDIFLKSQFVVFSKTESTPRLGFAAKST